MPVFVMCFINKLLFVKLSSHFIKKCPPIEQSMFATQLQGGICSSVSYSALGGAITIDVNEIDGQMFFGYFLSKKKVPAGFKGAHSPLITGIINLYPSPKFLIFEAKNCCLSN